MHKYPQNMSYVGSRGQTLTTNVSITYVTSKFVTKPMSYVAALHLYRIKIRYQINTVPTPAVAWTRAWLTQRVGGGYIAQSRVRREAGSRHFRSHKPFALRAQASPVAR